MHSTNLDRKKPREGSNHQCRSGYPCSKETEELKIYAPFPPRWRRLGLGLLPLAIESGGMLGKAWRVTSPIATPRRLGWRLPTRCGKPQPFFFLIVLAPERMASVWQRGTSRAATRSLLANSWAPSGLSSSPDFGHFSNKPPLF